jgi:2-amino-4-hydroxy-6-hydroxymethyldihydropteridine diphosphokinase
MVEAFIAGNGAEREELIARKPADPAGARPKKRKRRGGRSRSKSVRQARSSTAPPMPWQHQPAPRLRLRPRRRSGADGGTGEAPKRRRRRRSSGSAGVPVVPPAATTELRGIAPTQAWIGIGGNLGDARATVEDAIARLAGCRSHAAAAQLFAVSHRPIDSSGDDYVNAVALVSTTLSALELLHALQAIELQHGRERPIATRRARWIWMC